MVSAAASLTNVYTEFKTTFETAHPDVEVIFNFGASSDLVAQITEGAPADVFASADINNMTKLLDAELIDGEPQVFATNRLVIVRQLALAGFVAETAEDGLQGLEKWRSGRYALVLSDVHMPHLDGYEASREIRRREGATRHSGLA